MQIWPFVFLAIGLVFIIKGSDWFVDAAIWFAAFFRVPQLIIGAVLVSACTTLPESVVSVSSAVMGNSDIALGNAIGSIAFNTGFILGLVLLIARPSIGARREFFKNGALLMALLLYVMVNIYLFSGIPRMSGFILLGIFGLFLFHNVRAAKKGDMVCEQMDTDAKDFWRMAALFFIGAALTFFGARLLVINAERIAAMMHISDSVIGLTVAAMGTSLPELVTAIMAMRKNACNLCVGNIIGANIYNILMVIALSSTIGVIHADRIWLTFYVPMALLINLTLLLLAWVNPKRFTRLDGLTILALYGVYFVLMAFWI